jgi:hypothetical protein
VIDESDRHPAKHDDPRISTVDGISISDDADRLRINLSSTISIRNESSQTNRRFPGSIKQLDNFTPQKADPSIDSTFDGITID